MTIVIECSNCGKSKNDVKIFHPKLGLCKPCNRKLTYQKNKEKERKLAKTWQENNRAHKTEYRKKYYENNKEKEKLNCQKWRNDNQEKVKENIKKNKNKILSQIRKWHIDNREHRLQLQKKWQKNNLDKVAAINAKRRAAKLQRTPPWLTQEHYEQIKLFYIEARRLSKETGISHHVDHIVPLQGKNICGLHVPWNLQILTKTENLVKGNKYDDSY